MFYGCSSLEEVSIQGDLSPKNESNRYTSNFYQCYKLTNVSFTKILTAVWFGDCTKLTQESVNNIINALADGVTNQTITFAATQYGYVTEEQKTAATAKGWTINQA